MSETLEHGDSDLGPRSRVVPRVVGGLLAVALLCAWTASHVTARQAHDDLDGCARRAEAVVRSAENRLAALASYLAPSVDPSTYRTYEGLFEVLSVDAEKHVPSVEQARQECRNVDLWWTHHSERRARDAYVAWTEAELARLLRIAEDGRRLDEGYAEMRALQRDAERARGRL